jgi:hypothetical protein
VELHGVGGHAAPRVHRDRRVADRPARVRETEQRGEALRRAHGDQVAAALHPRRQARDLAAAQRRGAEHHQAVAGEHLWAQRADVRHVELVEALGPQDLR